MEKLLWLILIFGVILFVIIPIIGSLVYWWGNTYIPWLDDTIKKIIKRIKRGL